MSEVERGILEGQLGAERARDGVRKEFTRWPPANYLLLLGVLVTVSAVWIATAVSDYDTYYAAVIAYWSGLSTVMLGGLHVGLAVARAKKSQRTRAKLELALAFGLVAVERLESERALLVEVRGKPSFYAAAVGAERIALLPRRVNVMNRLQDGRGGHWDSVRSTVRMGDGGWESEPALSTWEYVSALAPSPRGERGRSGFEVARCAEAIPLGVFLRGEPLSARDRFEWQRRPGFKPDALLKCGVPIVRATLETFPERIREVVDVLDGCDDKYASRESLDALCPRLFGTPFSSPKLLADDCGVSLVDRTGRVEA